MKRITYLCSMLLMGAAVAFTSCDDNKTYAEKLADEKDAIKKFVAEQQIKATFVSEDQLATYQTDAANWLPGTTHFALSEWYKFDDNLYMRINNYGDTTSMFIKKNLPDIVIRFDSCYNLLTYDNLSSPFVGNENPTANPWYLQAWNPNYAGQFGTGLEFPLRYLGNNGNVSLIVPSKLGLSGDTQSVTPYFYKTVTYTLSNQ
ncbi:MAG: DUF4827 family protein [Bacteroidales bacterium]